MYFPSLSYTQQEGISKFTKILKKMIQTWKCSWSFGAIIVSLLVLVSVVHMFLFPIFPSSLGYFGVPRAPNPCFPINGSTGGDAHNSQLDLDLEARFPPDAHRAVNYRNAPWRVDVGRWLSGCDSISTKIDVNESIGGKNCTSGCSGQGICNQELGHCRCFHGFSGEGCSEKLQLGCNFPSSPEQPYGRWVVSICPAYCDTSRAMCFCGQGTKYPNRPVAEACGFQIIIWILVPESGQACYCWNLLKTKFPVKWKVLSTKFPKLIYSILPSEPGFWCWNQAKPGIVGKYSAQSFQ